jgi:hypothetical protein
MDFNRNINEDNYSSTELPTYPARTLAMHVGLKGIEAGSVLGLVAGVPLMKFIRKVPLGTAWIR